MKENQFSDENDFLEESGVFIGNDEVLTETEDIGSTPEEYAEEEVFDQEAFAEAYADKEFFHTPALAEDLFSEEDDPAVSDEITHELLEDPLTGEELAADEHAMYEAGLIHPEDAEYVFDEVDAYAPAEPEQPAEPYHDAEYRDPEYRDQFEEEALPEPEEADDMPVRRRERPAHKGRPRRKKGYGLLGIPHLIATVIWLAIIVAIGVSLGRIIWVCAADVLAFGREEKTVTVTITSEDTIEDIAEILHEAELIRYPELFKLYADLAVDEGEISTGTFTLNTLYDYHALVNGMSPSSSTRKVVEDVLIPEGFTCAQIFARLEEYGVCKASELEAYAASGELDEYWFLEGLERGDKYCLEGYLFPATYDFYENSSPKQALEKMLDAFDAYFSEEMQAQFVTLNERLSAKMRENGCTEEYIAENQLGLHEIVTVASMIEKEMAHDEESRVIASVIYNRLTQDEASERYLNIDATIFYALGEHKEALTAEDLQIDSPYNTYAYSGLIPGPIANPGLACLKAALDFEDTAYYYYVLDPETGEHVFSKTYEEHEKKRLEMYGA
ncbi:MAG: endolytic transglycosylase MltG [Oscillospiraceae bacterium]|nr:endolytic transglycosylase MltG [Oscillospiraceae bacterium]